MTLRRLVDRDLDAYVDRELDAESAKAVREHLNGCVACRRRVAERESLGRLVATAPSLSGAGSTARAALPRSAATRRAAAPPVRMGRRRGRWSWPSAAGCRCCDRTGARDTAARRRSGRRPRAFADGRPPVRRADHRSTHGQAVVPGQARLLAARQSISRQSAIRWSAAGWSIWADTLRPPSSTSAAEAHDQRVRLAGARGRGRPGRPPRRCEDSTCATGCRWDVVSGRFPI